MLMKANINLKRVFLSKKKKKKQKKKRKGKIKGEKEKKTSERLVQGKHLKENGALGRRRTDDKRLSIS